MEQDREPAGADRRGVLNARNLRVFVSSTFVDFEEERKYLAKNVFPELRRLCDLRGVVFSEIDLRWGVEDEEVAEGKVLGLCLEEIDRCRPCFIGMLGERFGWVPERIPDELVARAPWLREFRDRSVTELEIQHAVLGDPGFQEQAFFYFRDLQGASKPPEPGNESDARAQQRRDGSRTELATSERQKIECLKNRIHQAHVDGKLALPPRVGFRTPAELGDLVRRDLKVLVDRLFPANESIAWLEREAVEWHS